MLKHWIAGLAVIAAFALPAAHAEEDRMKRMISVQGQGEVRAVPDLAVVTIGVATTAASAREALDANTKAMNGLFEVLKKAGIAAPDIATSNFALGPRYDYNQAQQPPKILGYDVSNTVNVTVRQIDELGGLLDVAVTSGSNQINGILFSVSKPEAALDEARQRAVADAKRKAEVYAGAAGVAVGDLMSLSENVSGGLQPIVMRQSRAEAADAVPVAAGEQVLRVDVAVSFAVK